MQKKMLYLKNKLPLTKSLIRKHDIPPMDNFKYYYESAELLLEDYQSYMINFLKRTEKTASFAVPSRYQRRMVHS